MAEHTNRVGIIGLGIIGSRISDTLKQKGWEVGSCESYQMPDVARV